MTKEQEIFLQKAVIDQTEYAVIEKEMGVERSQLSKWWEELKEEREQLSKIRQIWRKKCSETGFWEFHKWYTAVNRKCHYCNINESQIKMLIETGEIHTKRLTTRGRTLEIERREPNKLYDETDNLVFSCYWCNNAKSDEFTEQEFEIIGNSIAEIWKSRLAKL